MLETSAPATPAVVVEGLRKTYGDQVVLGGVSFAIPVGTVFALLGPNGAGKTTTVRILSTLARADGGAARIAGHDLHEAPGGVRAALSVTGQSAAVDTLLTGRENLRLLARLQGLGRRAARDRAEQLLTEFDLVEAADRLAGSYSGGMRRRLDLALSLVRTPAVLFLDEPTTGLDPRSRTAVWERVRALVAQGTTVVLTTQYLEEADQLADRIAVIDEGRIVAEGSPAELKRRLGADRLEVELADGEPLSIPVAEGVPALRAALAEIPDDARSVALRKPSLDDVFLELTA